LFFLIVLPLQQPVAANFLLYMVHISEVREDDVCECAHPQK
jgi:hypothetical protein